MAEATTSSSSSQTEIAQKTWELNNEVKMVSSVDNIYRYDKQQQQDLLKDKPWDADPHFFKNVKISAIALLKMVMHARSGGNLEIMGLMLGKVEGDTMIVMDAFALPVEGTETRVNAQEQAYEYMSCYIDAAKLVGRHENAIGWYHSHPGYGCWLSGIDVETQMINQRFQDPFVAIVVDPVRTVTAGKVALGAFRTYPKNYIASCESTSEYQNIPSHKIDDFGVHCKKYYSLEVSYFKSSLDGRLLRSLWNKYWISTLACTSLLANSKHTSRQLFDISKNFEKYRSAIARGGLILGGPSHPFENAEEKIIKATKDTCKVTMDMIHGMIDQIIKHKLFNTTIFNNSNQ